MDVQVKPQSVHAAITNDQVSAAVADRLTEFCGEVVGKIEALVATGLKATTMLELENGLQSSLLELGRRIVEWLLGAIEPELDEMPGAVKHKGRSYRRLAEKTMRHGVVTRFGKVSIRRAVYRAGRAGKSIYPLEIAMGLDHGFTPAAADMIGKQFAATGSSQARTLDAIKERTGDSVGIGRLRKLVGSLSGSMEPYRQACQVEKLTNWIDQARKLKQSIVLSVSRDGVSLGIAPCGIFEMASVATISVLSAGKRLGTVYLGRTPEENQQTLSEQLTSLLKETLRSCGDRLPEVVYVTDAGKVETAFWKNVLRKFYVDGKRIKIHRVVDYYHAAERLTKVADALKLSADKRSQWLGHARGLLLEPGGHGRVLRSISSMEQLYGYKKSAAKEANEAERYLRRYGRFMDYANMRDQNFPIGSGVVESACKQIVSERLKLSGMRWKQAGAQTTITLRCLLLSGIWNAVYNRLIQSKSTVSDLMLAI